MICVSVDCFRSALEMEESYRTNVGTNLSSFERDSRKCWRVIKLDMTAACEALAVLGIQVTSVYLCFFLLSSFINHHSGDSHI